MIKTKEELFKVIYQTCKKNIANVNEIKRLENELKEKFNIPISYSFDILTLKKEIVDEPDNILFAFISVINDKKVPTFFTEKEINLYSKWKYKEDTVKFPYKIKMIEIASNQFIGKITVKELMKLRNAQLIHYNENTQRRLKRIISGNEEWYQIDINRDAVNAIIDSYKNQTYIPNTITLNMPETTEFSYNGEYLIINDISAFDILDGYHRYIAMSNIFNLDKKFEYSMELRIVQFPEDLAKQFIWQEDQKTKMLKIDSDSLNQYNPANNIVDRLNSGCLKGFINRNNGIIDYTTMSQLIGVLWFNNVRTKIPMSKIIEIKDFILDKFEIILSQDSTLLDKKINNKYLACIMLMMTYKIKDSNLLKEINKLYELVEKDDNKQLFSGRTFNAQIITRLKKLYERR